MNRFISSIKYWFHFLIFCKEYLLEKYVEKRLITKRQLEGNYTLFGNNKIFNSTIGEYSYVSFNTILYHTEVGRYCSIGPNCVIGFGEHLTSSLSTSPLIYNDPKFYDNEYITDLDKKLLKKVIIENDVWIGANVVIKNGVRIGNGAVIGAGSIVTKEIPDYAIAVGIPARIIKYRFEESEIKKYLNSKWWTLSKEELYEKRKDFFIRK